MYADSPVAPELLRAADAALLLCDDTDIADMCALSNEVDAAFDALCEVAS